MMCFSFFCGNPKENKKIGVLESCSSTDDEELPRPRASIPWVWSRKFHDSYELGEKLRAGSFPVVHEATILSSPHESFAVKVVNRRNLKRKQLLDFKDEVQILADIQHENIVRVYELYKDPNYFFVVMEKLSGGELFDRLCEIHTYNEMDARDAMRTIFEAVAYCHSHKVAHRDLKPENLLLKDVNDSSSIKVADFGFAKVVEKPMSLTTLCGSPMYTAPEVLMFQPYDFRCDNFSLGVILFAVLGGYPPFYHPTVAGTFNQIRNLDYKFHPEYWSGISSDAKNLIRAMLTLDPEKRITAEEALRHPWMTGRGEILRARSLSGNLQQFKKFNEERKYSTHATPVVKSASMYWLLTIR